MSDERKVSNERTTEELAAEIRHHIAVCVEDDLGYSAYAPDVLLKLAELARRASENDALRTRIKSLEVLQGE